MIIILDGNKKKKIRFLIILAFKIILYHLIIKLNKAKRSTRKVNKKNLVAKKYFMNEMYADVTKRIKLMLTLLAVLTTLINKNFFVIILLLIKYFAYPVFVFSAGLSNYYLYVIYVV